MISRYLILILFCLLGINQSFCIDTGQQIFRPDVRTLSIYNPDDFMAPPVIRLHGGGNLNVNFDIIGDDYEYLRYRLIHCNADWQPSRLMESEYLDGFNEVEVEDYAFSANTYIHYVNYNISLPDPRLRILMPGNYLLQVFPENQPSEVIFQARFSVSEEIAPIYGSITSKTDKGVNSEYQQLFLEVDISSLGNINPYQDLIISITQNNRPETTSYLMNPIRVSGKKVIYEHTPQLIFEAGNEYRRFETVRTDYPGMHVDSVKFQDGLWHAWLGIDSSRENKEYTFDSTQHGRFKIDEYNSSDPDLSADYVMVHFSLDPDSRIPGKIFVDGDFTNHIFDSSNLMKYDWNDGLYHTAIPLKQGSYNYQYVVFPDNNGKPTVKYIEGNKYETLNEYHVKVFLNTPGTRGHKLIGTFNLK